MKLLLLDKDGTIITGKSRNPMHNFVQSPEDQQMIPGAGDAISRYMAQGWDIAIVSNQGGVGFGFKTLKDALEEMDYALRLSGINRGYFCPTKPFNAWQTWLISRLIISRWFLKTTCWRVSIDDKPQKYIDDNWASPQGYRKPDGLMLVLAMKECASWPSETLMVSDRPEDESAAKSVGAKFMWAEEWRQGHE